MKYYLLNIAIDKYFDENIKDLHNASFDAERLQKALTENYGFELVERVLLNELATRENIIETINNLCFSLEDNDCLLIYFAGHGNINSKTKIGYWLPYDSNSSISSYIPHSTIIDMIEGIDAKHILIISDSCFSGTFLNNSRGDSNKHYEKLLEKKSRYVFSSGRDEPVSDGSPNSGSPFANSLINFLEKNENEYVSLNELITNVSKRTGSISFQQPIAGHIVGVGHEGGQFVFRRTVTLKIKKTKFSFEDIVCSFKTAQKLKELNIPQESIFGYYDVGGKIILKKNESNASFLCSAFIYEEISEFIPDFIEVGEDTYLAKSNRYDKLYKEDYQDWGQYDASIHYQKTFVEDTPYLAICKSIGYMVAFSKNENGDFNNLLCWGRSQAECSALMLLKLIEERKIPMFLT